MTSGGDTFKTLLRGGVPVTTFAQPDRSWRPAGRPREPPVLFKGWQAGGLSKSSGSGGLRRTAAGRHESPPSTSHEGGCSIEQDFPTPILSASTTPTGHRQERQPGVMPADPRRALRPILFSRRQGLWSWPAACRPLRRREGPGIAVEGLSSTLSYVSGGRVHSGRLPRAFSGGRLRPQPALRQPFDYLWPSDAAGSAVAT